MKSFRILMVFLVASELVPYLAAKWIGAIPLYPGMFESDFSTYFSFCRIGWKHLFARWCIRQLFSSSGVFLSSSLKQFKLILLGGRYTIKINWTEDLRLNAGNHKTQQLFSCNNTVLQVYAVCHHTSS